MSGLITINYWYLHIENLFAMSDTDSVPSSLDNETELDDSIASSLGSSPYVSDEAMIINSCAKADAFHSYDDLDIVTSGCRWEVKSLQLTQDEQVKILTKSKPADRSNISPDVYIITKNVMEEALKKRIIAFVDGLNGWVYMAPSLMPFLDAEGWHMQTATRLCDACIVTDSQPMRVLTFTVGEDKHGRSLQYSAQLARRIMYHIEENAGLSVSVIHGVIDEDAWKNEELFMTKTKEFEYMAREESFAQSLRMTFGKYKSITDTLCVMFGAARTEELQTAVLSLPPVKQHIGAEEIESHMETRLTPKKLTDHHLTCVICTEVFTDPATLQCNHTFCKSCLLTYNKTQTEAIQAKSITCPCCRQVTKVATPDSPVEEWISQLKPSHVIQGLMDDFGPGTHGTMVKVCYLCNKQEQETIATQWCSICDAVFCDKCIVIHNMMPNLSDHELVQLSNPIKIKGKRRLMCKRHKDKQIEMFCKDCQAAICQMCSSIEHRQCDNIVNLDNMTPLVKEKLTCRNTELRKHITATNNEITRTKSQLHDIRTNADDMKDKIAKAGKGAIETIMKGVKQLTEQVDKSSNEQIQYLQADLKSLEIQLQVHMQEHAFTASAVSSNCNVDMYAIYESMDVVLTDKICTDVPKTKRPLPGRVIFTHSMDKIDMRNNGTFLGEVIVVDDVSDTQCSPVVHQTINFKEDDDQDNPSLIDITVLSVDSLKVIVVTDVVHNRLKTWYVSEAKPHHEYLQFTSLPQGIAKLSQGQIAVNIPWDHEIVIVKVYPCLCKMSTVKTNKPYSTLASLSPSFLVAGTHGESHSIEILDHTGYTLEDINTGSICNPKHIHVTNMENFIVTGQNVHTVVSVTRNGEVVFECTQAGERAFRSPMGITTTSTGDILLAEEHKVIQLTESGQFLRDVVTEEDGIENVCGVCLDEDGLLYVTSGRYVKVFKFERKVNSE